MRLIVARCSIDYRGRLSTHLPEAVRLLMIKPDGTFMVWSDGGGQKVKPLNWMTPPCVIEEEPGSIVVRKVKGDDRLDIRVGEVLSDVTHDMGEAAALEKDGVERDLQELLAAAPGWCGEGFRLVRRAWTRSVASQTGRKRTGAGVSAWGRGARGRSTRPPPNRRSSSRASAGLIIVTFRPAQSAISAGVAGPKPAR